MMEIYQMARSPVAWDMCAMASREGKKAEAEKRAAVIYHRLMGLKPAELSNNEWCKKAGVSTSFFTNLRAGSEPSIGNLRDVLHAVGFSLPEFFVEEAGGRLVAPPSERALAELMGQMLPGLPNVEEDRRAEYLASVVLGVFGLPARLHASVANDRSHDSADSAAASPSRVPTRKAGSGRRRTG